MTIRYAHVSDLPAIKHAWNTCFPEDTAFGGWFFKNVWKAENTLLCFEENTLAAMLQMLPHELSSCGKRYKATYIYGAATMPEFRRRGLMGTLLNASFSEDAKKEIPLSVLIPQEKGLFDYYKKFSYEPVFSLCRQRFAVRNSSGNGMVRLMTEKDMRAFAALYESRVSGGTHIVRSLGGALMIFRYFSENGALALCVDIQNQIAATAFGYVGEGILMLQELLVKDGLSVRDVAEKLCGYCACKEASVSTPFEGFKSEPFACARVAPWSGLAFDWKKAYLNLLFN